MSRVAEALARANSGDRAELEAARPSTNSSPVLEEYPAEGGASLRRSAPVPPPSPRHVLSADSPVQAVAPRIAAQVAVADPLVTSTDACPRFVEQYRRLAATLYQAQAGSGLKRVMICSAVPGEGKTLTATNLALTLSGSYGQRVLLVDADLRNPSIHRLFGLPNSRGLGGYLLADADEFPVIHVSKNLAVVPAGPASRDPIVALVSDRMRHQMAHVASGFDWILLDTPPVALLPDANLLASMAEAVVFVVAAASTPYQLVQRAVAAVGPDRVLGVVLNKASDAMLPSNAYYPAYITAPQRS